MLEGKGFEEQGYWKRKDVSWQEISFKKQSFVVDTVREVTNWVKLEIIKWEIIYNDQKISGKYWLKSKILEA